MKKSELTFAEGFTTNKGRNNNPQMRFDWDKAAQIIKEKYLDHKDLVAEAGLQGDWVHTGGIIFEENKPTNNNYTYLSSNWATPTLILNYNGEEQEEIECYTIEENSRFDSDSKWDETSLELLGISL